jgi:hypothetical protein
MTTGQPGQDPSAQQQPWGQPQYPQPQYPQPQYPQPGQYPQPQYPQPGQYPTPQYQQPHYQQPHYQQGAPPPWGMQPPVPKPGTLALKPNDVGATLSAVFTSVPNVLRSVWPAFLPLVACSGLLGLVMAGALLIPAERGETPSTAVLVTSLAVGVPLYLIQIATSLLLVFATVRATADAVLGRRSDVAGIWRTSARSVPRAATLFGLGVLASLLVTGAVIGLVFLAYDERWATFALLLVVLILVVIAAALLVWMKLSFTIPAMVLEGDEPIGSADPLDTRPAGLFDSMGRSWRLTSRRAWRTLLIVVLMSFISSAVASVVSPLLQIPLSLLTSTSSETIAAIGSAISAALGAALSILPTLLTTITVTVLYADARIRDEQLAAAVLVHLQHRNPPNPWTEAGRPGDIPWAGVGVPPEQQPPYGQSAVQPE